MTARSLRHRAPLLWLVLPMLGGIAAGRAWPLGNPGFMLGIAAVAAGVAIAVAERYPRAWAAALVGTTLLAGAASYRLRDRRVPGWDELPAREARVVVRIDRVFPRTDASVAALGTIVHGEGAVTELLGQRVYISLRRSPAMPPPVRSAEIDCIGVLAVVPQNAPAGSFDRYLGDSGVHFRFSRGRVERIARSPARYYVLLEHAADTLRGWLGTGIAGKRPDLTAVFRAMMLGQKSDLSSEQETVFMHSGSMHLFAINGLHIAVVAVSLHALLALLRCPRPVAMALVLAALWFDVDTTGASPSAVRAFLLVACCEIGFVLRRRANGIASLSAAALIALLLDPNAAFSASFQMSYGVVLAILCFGLPLAEWLDATYAPFRERPKQTWTRAQRIWAGALRKLWPMLGIGSAAMLVSAITGPEFFSVIAPMAFGSNLVLVPLASLVIVAGCASVMAGALGFGGVTVLFNHAALVLLVMINAITRLTANLPSAWWPAHWRYDWEPPLALAALLGSMLTGYACKWRLRAGGWAPPFAVAAIAIILGVKFR